MAEKKDLKRGPKKKPIEEKKQPLPVSAKLKNHQRILQKIEPIIEKMDK
jgi:hypothetical protein